MNLFKENSGFYRFSFFLFILFSANGSAVIVPEPDPCHHQLAKLVSYPLRPRGSEVQEKYFKVIDDVAQEFQGKKKFNSPRAWRKKTAASGLPGLDLPTDVGGKAASASEMVKVFEYAGRHSLDLRDIAGGAHSRTLMDSEVPEQREIMKQVAQGKAYVAIAITEPEHGSDIAGMRSTSKKVEGGYIINGEKKYQARLENGTHVVIFTQAPNSSSEHPKLNAFVLPLDYPGLKLLKLEAGGLKGNSFGGISFDNLFVPEKFRIGEDGDGRKILGKHFTYWRIMQTSAALGTAKRALELTDTQLQEREVYGKPLVGMTHLTQQQSKLTYELRGATRDLEDAAKLYDEGNFEEADILATGAKAYGVEKAYEAAQYALKAHGAKGYSNEMDLEKRVRDLLGLTIADGASDVLWSSYARKVYGSSYWDVPFGDRKKKDE